MFVKHFLYTYRQSGLYCLILLYMLVEKVLDIALAKYSLQPAGALTRSFHESDTIKALACS